MFPFKQGMSPGWQGLGRHREAVLAGISVPAHPGMRRGRVDRDPGIPSPELSISGSMGKEGFVGTRGMLGWERLEV